MNKISVIIPVSSLVFSAVKARLECVRRAIADFYKGVEVVVVEQSLDGHFYFLPHIEGAKKVKLEYKEFNKAWCCDVGVKESSGEYVAIADADMYGSKNYNFESLWHWMQSGNKDWSFGWNRLVYTDNETREVALNGKIHPGWKHVVPSRGYSEGGIVCYKRDFFYKMGQMNECLREIGGIDNSPITRAKFLSKSYHMFPATICHLKHPQEKKSRRPTRFENIKIIRYENKNTKTAIDWLVNQEQGRSDAPLCARKEFLL